MIKQRGATLIEMMIAMLLGITALSVLSSVIGMGVGSNGRMLAQTRLKEELSSIMALIVRDVRRAGYFANTNLMVADPTNNPNPFANSIVVSEFAGEAANSCLLYSYDGNGNGVIDAAPSEAYGFRLRENSLEMRQGGLTCTEAGWQDLTDDDVVSVTGLTFNVVQTVANNVNSYEVTVTLQGTLADLPNVSRTYAETFLVRAYD